MSKYESNEFSPEDLLRILDRVQELYHDHSKDVKESVDNEIPHETALCEACQVGKCLYMKQKKQTYTSGLIKSFGKMVSFF